MTDPAGIPALIDAIRHMHDCGAKHVETVHVHEKTPVDLAVLAGFVRPGESHTVLAKGYRVATEGK